MADEARISQFDRFLADARELELIDIHSLAQKELAAAEGLAKSNDPHRRSQQLDAKTYAGELRRFLFFLGTGHKPHMIDQGEFMKYREVVEALVRKGNFRATALDIF